CPEVGEHRRIAARRSDGKRASGHSAPSRSGPVEVATAGRCGGGPLGGPSSRDVLSRVLPTPLTTQTQLIGVQRLVISPSPPRAPAMRGYRQRGTPVQGQNANVHLTRAQVGGPGVVVPIRRADRC